MPTDDIPARLRPPQWQLTDWETDLLLTGSLPDVTVDLNDGNTWDRLHLALQGSDLPWEYWYEGVLMADMVSADELFSSHGAGSKLLKVWVGPLQFNSHCFIPTELDFDIEVAVLGNRAGFECLVAFMDWIATVTGNPAVMTHEGGDEVIRTSEPMGDLKLALEALHLADLRNPYFVEYRGVIATRTRLIRSRVDLLLEAHSDPDQVSSAINQVPMRETIGSVETDDVLELLAKQVSARWREELLAQLPDMQFEVGISNGPNDNGPTVWMRRTSPVG